MRRQAAASCWRSRFRRSEHPARPPTRGISGVSLLAMTRRPTLQLDGRGKLRARSARPRRHRGAREGGRAWPARDLRRRARGARELARVRRDARAARRAAGARRQRQGRRDPQGPRLPEHPERARRSRSRSRPRRSARTTFSGASTRWCRAAGTWRSSTARTTRTCWPRASTSWCPSRSGRPRYGHINAFEQLLVDSDVIVLKFYLHISRDEQYERLLRAREGPAHRLEAEPRRLARAAALGRGDRPPTRTRSRRARRARPPGTSSPPTRSGSATWPCSSGWCWRSGPTRSSGSRRSTRWASPRSRNPRPARGGEAGLNAVKRPRTTWDLGPQRARVSVFEFVFEGGERARGA